MIYRCRGCRQEQVHGVLPGASCGLYALALVGVSAACLTGIVRWLVAGIGNPPAERVEPPWWVEVTWVVLGGGAVLTALVAGMFAINILLQLTEFLVVARRTCPACGARGWSWGFTRGHGL